MPDLVTMVEHGFRIEGLAMPALVTTWMEERRRGNTAAAQGSVVLLRKQWIAHPWIASTRLR
jgi:hypothetical protein